MDRTAENLSRWSILPSHMMILLSIWCMLEPRGHVISLPLTVLFVSLSVVLVADMILLGREVRLPVFAAVNTACASAAAFLVQRMLVLSVYSGVTHIIFSTMILLLFTDVVITSLRTVGRTELVYMFDISIVLEGTLIAVSGTTLLSNPSQFIIWGFISCIVILMTLTILRVRQKRGERSAKRSAAGYAVLALVIAVLSFLAFLSMRDLESVSSSLVSFLTRVISAIGSFLRRIIDAFYAWLNSLFGESYVYDFDVDAYSQRVGTEIYREYKDVSWLIPVIAVVVITVGLILIIRFRRKHLGRRRKKEKEGSEQRTRIRSGRASRLYRRLIAPIVFWIRYLRKRSTPAGRFIRFERRMRRKGVRRPAYETPHAFLRRLAPSYPEENLNAFADELECIFYSSGACPQSDSGG
ncbi:MAG: DUF3488 domain-containing protein [Sphaerochaetaceae bacterium]|nr:DUF3488 domain-containing protein [Sphaerochaetaceae bacterium]